MILISQSYRWLRLGLLTCVAMLAGAGLTGCDGAGSSGGDAPEDGRPVVVATTTMVADLARVLGGDDVEVVGIMKPGEDPHVYDVRPNDARVIAGADLVLMNGLHLESTLGNVVEHNAQGAVVKLAEEADIELLSSGDLAGAPDPHVWMDPLRWRRCADVAAAALIELLPDQAQAIEARRQAFAGELDALHENIRTRFEALPADQRVIVTSHDAFAYFGEAYGVEVHGVIGISTEQQPRPQDVQALHSLITDRGVRAVFIESSTTATLNAIVEKVAEETGAAVGGTLYSDSLGDPDTPEGTYLGMMRHNYSTIADALAD